ncbi:MAG: multiheme c-type cytochrome, partial [bacterium]
MKRKIFILVLMGCLVWVGETFAQTYVGSQVCMTCHNTVNADKGYNIWEMYMKTGHPFKLNPVSGAPPQYPANTSPGVPNPPPGTNWDDFSYVIGGYGWKARFVKKDGKIFTAGDQAQYNLETQGWVAYHKDQDKPYNYGCFQCHTTGPDPNGSWNNQTADLGTFNEPGVRCEACHGPGSDHVGNPTGVKPPITADSLRYNRCGD